MWLYRFRSINGDYLVVGDYLAHGEYEQAMSALDLIPVKYDLSSDQMIDFEQVREIYAKIVELGINDFEESFVVKLEAYAESKQGKSCFLARTLLRNYGKFYPPILDIPSEAVENRSEQLSETKILQVLQKVQVYPNPADYLVDFRMLDATLGATEIRVLDASGKEIASILMDNKMEATWMTDKVKNGLYFYHLLKGDEVLETGSIMIAK